MALPQQVLDTLSREPPKTPGWSVGLLSFAGGLLFVVLAIYFGLLYGYKPQLQKSLDQLTTNMDTAVEAIPASDENTLVSLYSQIVNIKEALAGRTTLSGFLEWLGKNTEANVYYTNFSFSSGGRVALQGVATTEADVNQQAAVFEAAPEVKSVNVSSVSLDQATGRWNFSISIVMNSL